MCNGCATSKPSTSHNARVKEDLSDDSPHRTLSDAWIHIQNSIVILILMIVITIIVKIITWLCLEHLF